MSARRRNGSRRAERAAQARERAEINLRAHAIVLALTTRHATHLRRIQLVNSGRPLR